MRSLFNSNRNRTSNRDPSRSSKPTFSHRLALESLEQRTMLHGSLSGFVYVDGDADGARDTGESGIPGVVIELTGNATGGGAVTLSEMTDDTGAYSFTELNPGTYTITQRQPEAHLDGQDTFTFAGAVGTNDSVSNIVLATDQVAADINFGERGLRPEFVSIRSFLASTPAPSVALREINAIAADAAGNSTLADDIRNGAGDTPDNGGNEDDLFGPVTTGDFDDEGLLGTRTDLVSGAPAITQDHISTAFAYTGYSNPPTYGPHHGPINDAQGNSITPRPTGVYTTEQHDEDLVHNLEHGHVWISYNPTMISAADKAALEGLVTGGGTNTGVILTPRSQNTTTIAVASWAHLLTLGAFDEAQIRAFIETNRGHAPEGFIRSGQKGSGSGSETLDDGLLHTRTPLTAFANVTQGSETDANLLGTRTDQVSGAPAVTRDHVTTPVNYTGFSNPPSYGPHHGVVQDDDGGLITPRPTGIYTTEQPDEDLVHNLEHGHVWISYDPSLISATDKTALEQLITAGGTNNGVIMTPRADNTSAIVLTSWIHQLSLNSFNATTIRNFIETNRGHSPEGFIPSGQRAAGAAGETLDDDFDHS